MDTPINRVVVSADGQRSLELISFSGSAGVDMRDATGFWFDVRTSPNIESSRLVVVFANPALSSGSLKSYGLPEVEGRQERFVVFAEARIA